MSFCLYYYHEVLGVMYHQIHSTQGRGYDESVFDLRYRYNNNICELINARSVGTLPRNSQQVAYYKSKEKLSGHSSDVLYNVMLQCKSRIPGKEFVRAVVAAPKPMAILASEQQLDNMVRFLTNSIEFAIMGVDPTFNFREFNVIPIVYWNLLLEHRTKGHSPLMLEPMLVHQQKKFSSYNYLHLV